MKWVTDHWQLVVGGLVIVLEQVLPHLPVKANSTVQLVLDVAKSLLPKANGEK